MTDTRDTAHASALARRRAYVRASVVMAVVFGIVVVALALAFPDAHGRSLPVAFVSFDRQAWLIAAASVAVGCACAAFVYAHVARPPPAK